MCGIVGVVRLRDHRVDDSDKVAVRRMAAAIIHRGPDGYGEHVHDGVMFAMRRLSIIDLVGGKQPLFNESGTVAVVANGEIYNHQSLRRELEISGHRFRTHSDCETIVHAYEEYGDECVSRLRGMFAFALHDMRRGCVLLARDRLGEKPLYLAQVGGSLLFASELRAVLASGQVQTEFDPSSLFTFFHYGYIPEPHTAIVGVRKLPAGEMVVVSTVDGSLQSRRYWSLADVKPRLASPADVAAVVDEVSRFITGADVPVGVALSGGLDSGAIAVLAAAHSKERLHAFTVGYDEDTSSDETAEARRVAEHAGIHFHSIRLQTQDVIDTYPETLWLKDDPNSDIAGPGYLAVMRAAHQAGVPVLLVGQGGDELFWGYPWLVEAARRTRSRMDGLGSVVSTWLGYAMDRQWTSQSLPFRSLNRARQLATDIVKLMADVSRLGETGVRPLGYDTLADYQAAQAAGGSFFGHDFLGKVEVAQPYEIMDRREIREAPPEAGLIQFVCDTYLRENGLAQADRLSMSSSIEVRVPLVDYRLAELAYGHQLAAGPRVEADKGLLKAAFADVCPRWMLDRPKRGFTPPAASWNARIHRRYAPLLKDGILVGYGVLAAAAATRIAQRSSVARRVPQLHRDAVALELWCRQIVAGAPLAQREAG